MQQYAHKSALAICSGLMALCILEGHSVSAQTVPQFPNLDQGWTVEERRGWYSATQGSRLIPAAWLRALEIPGGGQLFLDPVHIASFGYLPHRATSAAGPLPVGFAIDTSDDRELDRTKLRWKAAQGPKEPWVGLNCAACHTGEITYRGRSVRIDGAPATSADFKRFVQALNISMEETRSSPGRWERFSARVLPGTLGTQANRIALTGAFDKLLQWQRREAAANQTSLAYGPGRVDAFGHIYNKIALLLSSDANGNLPDAPVSIPHIWRATQYDKVQYNGIAKKIVVAEALRGGYDVGALGRNLGEVIGVFGDVVPISNPSKLRGFPSSVRLSNLSKMEDTLAKLRPPRWPKELFEYGLVPEERRARDELAAKGESLFARHCASCHEVVPRSNLTFKITTQLSLFDRSGRHSKTQRQLPAPGTDPWMACNSYDYEAASGTFEGLENPAEPAKKISVRHPVAGLLQATVASILYDQKANLTLDALARLIGADRTPVVDLEGFSPPISTRATPVPQGSQRTTEKQERLERCMKASSPLLGYTSRPLNGIWASPPYLHNGSVPTIYDLLLSPNERPKAFHVGTREYDPLRMGFVTTPDALGNTFRYETHGIDGLPIDGNSNAGHDYDNANFTQIDRMALIEYLKKL